MISLRLITVGRLKSGPLRDAYDEYARRLHWRVDLVEIDIRDRGREQNALENQAILDALTPAPLFVLDERGKTMKSADFAASLQRHFDASETSLQFVIGGAEGLSAAVRDRARQMISFGAMTWPHMLARVMLVEQLYRAQQILAGHPYHREG